MIIKEVEIKHINHHDLSIDSIKLSVDHHLLHITGDFHHVFGFGEKYDAIDQKGKRVQNKVIEQFCNQQEKTYFPLPFFFMDNQFGCYIETRRVFTFDLTDGIQIDLSNLEDTAKLYLIKGNYKEMIQDFISLTGKTLLPPKWAFGPWMSAHRWNSQKLLEEQLKLVEELDLPFTTLVLEQWSDEATFYIFNGATYEPKEGFHSYDDFTFDEDGPWPNPKQMIETIHQKGLKLLLWQAPVVKELEPHESHNVQHDIDQQYVVDHSLVVKQTDQNPYQIPKGHWFPGSYIPDFTNQDMCDWWFGKRQYLLDIGVDGFKTDGGEFVHREDTIFSNGLTGIDKINEYPKDYIEAYHQFVGDERVLFSRAGYIGQQSISIQWAGDQKSTWSELKSVYNAGITASLSGQTFWGFDIGGFAGDIPPLDLYIRGTQFAVFTPIMQIHSEPIGGQFALLDASKVMNNERTPWNMVKQYDREDLLPLIRELYWLRMNLLPYIYSESIKAVENNHTLMKHLMIDYQDDPEVLNNHHQYLFGDLMVVPVLDENSEALNVYFPEGRWHHLLSNEIVDGKQYHQVETKLEAIHVYIKEGHAVVLNLGNEMQLPSSVGNKINEYNRLVAFLYGEQGQHLFKDNQYDFEVTWNNNTYQLNGNYPNELTIHFK